MAATYLRLRLMVIIPVTNTYPETRKFLISACITSNRVMINSSDMFLEKVRISVVGYVRPRCNYLRSDSDVAQDRT